MLEIENLGLVEMDSQEVQEVDGGFLPLVVIGACWGIMACSSLVAIGIARANNLQPDWK